MSRSLCNNNALWFYMSNEKCRMCFALSAFAAVFKLLPCQPNRHDRNSFTSLWWRHSSLPLSSYLNGAILFFCGCSGKRFLNVQWMHRSKKEQNWQQLGCEKGTKSEMLTLLTSYRKVTTVRSNSRTTIYRTRNTNCKSIPMVSSFSYRMHWLYTYLKFYMTCNADLIALVSSWSTGFFRSLEISYEFGSKSILIFFHTTKVQC